MDYKIITAHLVNNDCYKLNRLMKPIGVIVHSTATRGVMFNTGINPWCKRWNKAGVTKLCHAMIDKTGIYETLQTNRKGWHAGGDGNGHLVGFEICEPVFLSDKAYFADVWDKAVWYVAQLCKAYGWKVTPQTVKGHFEAHQQGEASNHADPGHWFPKHNKTMDDFRNDVRLLLDLTPIDNDKPKPIDIPKTIAIGAHGDVVKRLQLLLNDNGARLVVDGYFGAKTEAAVKRFQTRNGLLADGITGRKTWYELLF
jgi:N-acetylmuramoyl-L-alanine amidase